MTGQEEDTKPEIVDQSPKYVFETAPTEPEDNLSSAVQMLIGGLIGFSPIVLLVFLLAWGEFFNPTVLICGSAIFVLAGSALAFTQQEGVWKPLAIGLLSGYFGGFAVVFVLSGILVLVAL